MGGEKHTWVAKIIDGEYPEKKLSYETIIQSEDGEDKKQQLEDSALIAGLSLSDQTTSQVLLYDNQCSDMFWVFPQKATKNEMVKPCNTADLMNIIPNVNQMKPYDLIYKIGNEIARRTPLKDGLNKKVSRAVLKDFFTDTSKVDHYDMLQNIANFVVDKKKEKDDDTEVSVANLIEGMHTSISGKKSMKASDIKKETATHFHMKKNLVQTTKDDNEFGYFKPLSN